MDKLELKKLVKYAFLATLFFSAMVMPYSLMPMLAPNTTLQLDASYGYMVIRGFIIGVLFGVTVAVNVWCIKGIEHQLIIRSPIFAIMFTALMGYVSWEYIKGVAS